MNATSTRIDTDWVPDGWYPCNPSIAEGPDGYALIVTLRDLRRADDGIGHTFADHTGAIRTRNFFSYLDADLKPTRWTELAAPDGPVEYPAVQGVEDPRLYWSDGWKYSGSIFQHHPSGEPRVARCDVSGGLIDILDAPPGVWVKNLMPTGAEPEFIDAMVTRGDLHGGAVTRHNDGWLGVVHEVVWPGRRYWHRFARFDNSGSLTALSDRFRFTEFPIEFAAGLVAHRGDIVVSYGIQDREAWLARFPAAEVEGAL